MDGAIYKAVESDNPEGLKALIARGANVNEYYHDYTLISAKSILHICCEKGRLECAKVCYYFGTCIVCTTNINQFKICFFNFLNIIKRWVKVTVLRFSPFVLFRRAA